MTRTAWLFPGQGFEEPGMGTALLERSPRARELVSHASSMCGVDLVRTLTRGGTSLARTEVLQPALAALSLASAIERMERGVSPDCVMGHSLGELVAWAFAAGIDPLCVVEIAALRGRAMADAARDLPGGMAALRASRESVRALLEEHTALAMAACNAPDETVISGPHDAIDRVLRVCEGTRLRVAGAWHSELMRAAQTAWKPALEGVQVRDAFAWWSATTARETPVREGSSVVLRGVCETVQFHATLTAMAEQGVSRFVCVGPSRVMRGLVRRCLGTGAEVVTSEV